MLLPNKLDGPSFFLSINKPSLLWSGGTCSDLRIKRPFPFLAFCSHCFRNEESLLALVFDCCLRTRLRGCPRAAFLEVTYFFHLTVTSCPTSKAACAKLRALFGGSRVQTTIFSWHGNQTQELGGRGLPYSYLLPGKVHRTPIVNNWSTQAFTYLSPKRQRFLH